jgi:hypothetical protein
MLLLGIMMVSSPSMRGWSLVGARPPPPLTLALPPTCTPARPPAPALASACPPARRRWWLAGCCCGQVRNEFVASARLPLSRLVEAALAAGAAGGRRGGRDRAASAAQDDEAAGGEGGDTFDTGAGSSRSFFWLPFEAGEHGSGGAGGAGGKRGGELLVRAELHLPALAAREAPGGGLSSEENDSDDEDDKEEHTSPLSLLAKFRAMKETLTKVQESVGQMCDLMERFKNWFCWVHPKKTRLLMCVLAFQCVVLCVMPSRFVFLGGGLYMLTDWFRAPGTAKFKLKRFLSNIPSDVELEAVFKPQREAFLRGAGGSGGGGSGGGGSALQGGSSEFSGEGGLQLHAILGGSLFKLSHSALGARYGRRFFAVLTGPQRIQWWLTAANAQSGDPPRGEVLLARDAVALVVRGGGGPEEEPVGARGGSGGGGGGDNDGGGGGGGGATPSPGQRAGGHASAASGGVAAYLKGFLGAAAGVGAAAAASDATGGWGAAIQAGAEELRISLVKAGSGESVLEVMAESPAGASGCLSARERCCVCGCGRGGGGHY